MYGFLQRALRHSRGTPDTVVITVEKVAVPPVRKPLLSFSTLPCASPSEAEATIRAILRDSGISQKAVAAAIRIITSARAITGASLVDAATGRRREPDRKRGVRVSRLGIGKESERRLGRRLARAGINSARVREALVLASKVASCEGILAEVCISDDPDYTTGYVASRSIGYLRIPNIKEKGAMHGGRVFFTRRDVAVDHLIVYLEKTPAIFFLPETRVMGKTIQKE